MRMPTFVLAGAVAATATVPLAGVALAADRDCRDFSSQAQAQAALRPGDPDRLDANHNGQACEDYDYGSGSTAASPVADGGSDQVGRKPVGAVDAGGGPLADTPDPAPEPFDAAALVVGTLAAGGIGAVSTRGLARRLR